MSKFYENDGVLPFLSSRNERLAYRKLLQVCEDEMALRDCKKFSSGKTMYEVLEDAHSSSTVAFMHASECLALARHRAIAREELDSMPEELLKKNISS